MPPTQVWGKDLNLKSDMNHEELFGTRPPGQEIGLPLTAMMRWLALCAISMVFSMNGC